MSHREASPTLRYDCGRKASLLAFSKSELDGSGFQCSNDIIITSLTSSSWRCLNPVNIVGCEVFHQTILNACKES
jgi:hypothetical protein